MWSPIQMHARLPRGLCAALLFATSAISAPLAAQTATLVGDTGASPPGSNADAAVAVDGITPHINAVLYDPAVRNRIEAWGLTVADVKHDIDSLQPAQRLRLAYLLNRRWRSNETHSAADLKAQFLVMLSLMRESTLFASVIASGPARLLR